MGRIGVALAAVAVAAGLAGCSSEPGSTSAFCAQVAEVPSLESTLAQFSDTDEAVLLDRIDKARQAYHRLADAAPAKIESDTAEVVALVDDVLDAVEAHPDDPTEAADQLRKAMADHEGVEEARAGVAAFAQEQCDVRLDPTFTEGPPTTATTAPTGTATTGTATSDGTDPAGPPETTGVDPDQTSTTLGG